MTKDYGVKSIARLLAYKQDLLGVAELAQVLGLTKQAVCNRNARGKLPEPHAKLHMTPVWTKQQIMQFLRRL